ncbi:MAG: M48 family metalloprotease [Gammaproteobacteria bacterium]
MNRIIGLALIALLIGGCATTGNVSAFKNASATSKLQDKESRLWYEADEYDTTIARSGQIYNDRRATAYIQSVMDRLYPEFKGRIHVHIYDSTQLNAFALPNGSIYVNIGMLARMENEAQLATVLAHEGYHFVGRHSFKERVSAKNASAFAVSGIPFSKLAAVSSISGFSRDLEREADMKGYKRVVKSGYDPHETYKVFQRLADEVKTLGIEEPYFFSSHPRLVERIKTYKELSAKYKHGGRRGKRKYNKIMASIRLDALSKDIGQDRYKSVILVMEDHKLRSYFPAAGYYYLGEAYLRRDEKDDAKLAMKAFHKAEKLAPRYAPTYKSLGMHYMKIGYKRRALRYFKKYLHLAPRNAQDKSYVQQYINSLK